MNCCPSFVGRAFLFAGTAVLIAAVPGNMCRQPDDGTGNGSQNGTGDMREPVLDSDRYPTDRPRLNGVEYYVATDGNDANPGTLETPWATVQHAAEVMEPGNIVYLRGGVYRESVVTVRSGTARGDIVFAAYSGEEPAIDGTGVDANNGFIIAHDYIVLRGLTIRNWPDNGIWIETSGFTYLIDCEVYDVTYGIGGFDGMHDFVFDHVVAHDFDLYGFDVSPGIADGHDGVFWQCAAYTGRDPDQNVDGFALGHGMQHDFLFYRCQTYDVYDGFDVGENAGSDTGIIFDRCLAHDCWNDGFKLTGTAELVNCLSHDNNSSNVGVYWAQNAGTATLRNCTFANSGTFNIWVENARDSLHMYNCIVAGGAGIGLAFEQTGIGNYRADYNLFHNANADRVIAVAYEDEFSLSQVRAGAWSTYSGQDAHSVTAASLSKLFLDVTNLDFHLAMSSPAVDAGTADRTPASDYDGSDRPQGTGIDIGAFEQ